MGKQRWSIQVKKRQGTEESETDRKKMKSKNGGENEKKKRKGRTESEKKRKQRKRKRKKTTKANKKIKTKPASKTIATPIANIGRRWKNLRMLRHGRTAPTQASMVSRACPTLERKEGREGNKKMQERNAGGKETRETVEDGKGKAGSEYDMTMMEMATVIAMAATVVVTMVAISTTTTMQVEVVVIQDDGGDSGVDYRDSGGDENTL
jgi:hypothetical protein